MSEQNITELNSYSSRNLDTLSLSYNIPKYLIVHAIFKLGHVRFTLLQKVKQEAFGCKPHKFTVCIILPIVYYEAGYQLLCSKA